MKTIGDIDDARLGKAIKALLHRAEQHGGQVTIGREFTPQYPYGLALSTPGVEAVARQPGPGDWSVSIHFATGEIGRTKSASISHEDALEVIERIEAALR